MRRSPFLLSICLLASSCAPGDRLIVASKNFSENVFLAELVAQHVEARLGIPVDRRFNLGGTFLCHQALVSGEADLYPEYTGTALTAILESEVVKDPGEALRQVRLQYVEQFQVEWMGPFGFEDTYAILVRGDEAPGLKTISDLADRAADYRIGFNFEFVERADGWEGLQGAYGLEFGSEPVTMDLSLVYQALAERRIDVAVGNSTHGLISKLGLRRLQDDRRYFPPYDAATVVRSDAFGRFPGLREALVELEGRIDDTRMREINREIDVEMKPVEQAVREFRSQHLP